MQGSMTTNLHMRHDPDPLAHWKFPVDETKPNRSGVYFLVYGMQRQYHTMEAKTKIGEIFVHDSDSDGSGVETLEQEYFSDHELRSGYPTIADMVKGILNPQYDQYAGKYVPSPFFKVKLEISGIQVPIE